MTKTPKLCSIAGCEEVAAGRGLCRMHYMRWWKNGTTDLIRAKATGPCSVPGCGRPMLARQMCGAHWSRWKRTGDAQPDKPVRFMCGLSPGGPCSVKGCIRPSKIHGLCSIHYVRKKRNGSPGPAGLLNAPDGKRRYTNPDGYIIVSGRRSPDSPKNHGILEHRAVMERVIGRQLKTTERVHHVNGKRADNRPENLELWSTDHPCGQRVMDLLAWAHKIIDEYQPLFPS